MWFSPMTFVWLAMYVWNELGQYTLCRVSLVQSTSYNLRPKYLYIGNQLMETECKTLAEKIFGWLYKNSSLGFMSHKSSIIDFQSIIMDP